MTAAHTAKLLSIASESLVAGAGELSDETRRRAGDLAEELAALLTRRNGFYAFESALHVFPSGRSADTMTIDLWNSPSLWRDAYGALADECLFFAEDVFGGQFCISGDAVLKFDPETGDKAPFAGTLDQWAHRILEDYNVETGYPLAHEWQTLHGPLAPGQRLFPKYPFVLGGQFSLENLRAFDAVAGMRFLGEIATQIHDLPDGSKINVKVIE